MGARLIGLAASCLLTLWITSPMSDARAAEATTVTLGTATPGGGFPVYGEAFAAVVNARAGGLRVVATNTKGSTENVPLLEAEKLDIALVQGEVAMEALGGIGRAPARLAVVTAMYATPGMFVVTAASPYRSIADLKGRRVVFGARGSGLGILARYVLDGLGLDRDKDFDAVFLDRAGDGPPLVLSGEAAALWGGGSGWPGFLAMAKAPGGARFIVPDADEIARILAKHPFLKRLTVPAGSLPGQGAAITSVGSWSLVLARPSLPDETAYALAKALHEGEADLGRRLSQAGETTAANTIAAVSADRLHPGVVRYYREAGLLP
ncbi:MAG: TAXI family TRAP transporter solute-binding subunit [Hyphomicrobiaceae bacterium]|nr:TAXI family TRAP transporter solute-binding subunit [Hyphomicrobiaceae bacterium]